MWSHCHSHPQPGVNNELLVTLPCYEPAGQRLQLTEAELKQHLLVIGSTGSGKTTLLWNIVEQLVPHRVGLLILDAKCDGLEHQLTTLAKRCGRERDVVWLGPDGSHALDLFGRLHSYDDVELVTQLLLLATEPMHSDNAYWQSATTALIASALTLLYSPSKPPPTFQHATDFMRRWFFHGSESELSPAVAEVITRAKRAARRAGAPAQLGIALDQVEIWKRLDPRTRSNLQSCLMNVLRPLLSSVAGRCFDTGKRPRFNLSQVAAAGKLCVVSVNVLTHPALAGFVLRLARREFCDAVQARGPGEHRLCALVADEFALIAEREDVDQLATLRSKRCCVLAATQGLASLDERLGERRRKAVLLNFNTLAFMRTREEEAGEFAALSLGRWTPPRRRRAPEWSLGDLLTSRAHLPVRSGLVCPLGALGNLQPHQAYVVTADGNRTQEPVWFVPHFEREQVVPPAPPVSPQFTAAHVLTLMERNGMRPVLSAGQINCVLHHPAWKPTAALAKATAFFRSRACLVPHGLETLPVPWLAGLPGILWSMREPHWAHVPYMINRVACVDGVLLMGFAQELEGEQAVDTSWDRIRVQVNERLAPNRWRRLSPRHRRLLGQPACPAPGDAPGLG